MTDLLERAVETARRLAPDMQDAVARLVLDFAADPELCAPLTPEEEASFAESLAQAERREFATDEEVRAIWAKHGL